MTTSGVGAATRIVFKQQPTHRYATEPFGVQVAFLDDAGNPTYGSWLPVTITINKGTFQGPAQAWSSYGVASFGPLSLSEPGTDYVLRAASDGFRSIESEPFSIAYWGLTSLSARIHQSPVTLGVETVMTLDNFNNVYTGTVAFTSDDPEAILPERYTFTAADAGEKTFPVTFNTMDWKASRYVEVKDGVRSAIASAQVKAGTP